jgi:hypothetical protein
MKGYLFHVFFYCFIFLPVFLNAQVVFTGNVKNAEGIPVQVTVTIQANNSKVITGYASTDNNGNYKLSYTGTADSVIITVSSLNAGKHTKKAASVSGNLNFIINEKPIELKEAVVNVPKLKYSGDTLTYQVSAYIDNNDRVIGDVLKKLPGITVALSGQIWYNGKAINKFYVENMDLLQGRYGIATNNIAAKDVAAVEVLENHQPIKALKDRVFNSDAAINLKLKEEAKGTLAVTALAGGGYKPCLWNAELTSMYFSKIRQHLSTYKTNNTGDDVTREFRSFQSGGTVIPNSLLYVQTPSLPPVAQKRYLENNVHAVTINNLFKISENYELNINGIYFNDRQGKNAYSLSEVYLANDSIVSIEESVRVKTKVHNADLLFRLNSNTDNYYFNNILYFTGNWNDDNGISNTKGEDIDETIMQQLDKPSYNIKNSLNLIRNIGKHSYNLNFEASFLSQPHSLKVSPALYNFLENNIQSLNQDAHTKSLNLKLNSSYGIRLGNFNMEYRLYGLMDINKLNTNLTGVAANNNNIFIADSMTNDFHYNNYQLGVNQTYSYKKDRVKTSLDLFTAYYLLDTDNRIQNKETSKNKILFHSNLWFSYDLLSHLTASITAGYNNSFGNLSDSYTGYIMHGYRNLLHNLSDQLLESRSGRGELSLMYNNPINMWHARVNAGYSRNRRNLLSGYTYQGIISIKNTIDQPTVSERFGVGLYMDKGTDFLDAVIRLSADYTESSSEQFIQNNIIAYNTQYFRINPSIEFKPFSFTSIYYSFVYAQSKNYTKGNSKEFPAIKTASQNGRINFYITRALTLNMMMEHQYNSSIIVGDRYIFFADASLKFKHKQFDIELGYNNIFNTKHYVSARYNDINTYYYTYELRPANLLLKIRFKLK